MDHIKSIANKLNLPNSKVKNTVALIKEDNTIPFIARYRKELTGNLDEVEIRNIKDELNRLENLEDRRNSILNAIRESGKLTSQLEKEILEADTLTYLEDLYQPYKQKKKTRAMAAREKGLEPLAMLILEQPIIHPTIEDFIPPYYDNSSIKPDEAISGASDIIAEIISEHMTIRKELRDLAANSGIITCEKRSDANDERQVYQDYYQFEQRIKNLHPHQTLAINRGENENVLRVHVQIEERDWKSIIFRQFQPKEQSLFYEIFISAMEDGAKRLLLPTISRDTRRDINEKAEEHAIQVFAKNFRALLTQPPISDRTILGIDPGFRTGSKVVVIDPNGKYLAADTIYPHPPHNKLEQAYSVLINLINQFKVSLIVIGNGTASRETEQLIAEITKQEKSLHYLITSEAGASVYSASPVARKEFPDLDVSMRGAVSIARRVQDPLAELVKIDPRSVGVGLYQHDLNQSKLSDALDQVVESVVNSVGVEINTASAELLSHVAGIGPTLAEKIVSFREENGPFANRQALFKVQGLGPKTFEQAAGFLRIRNSDNPLDATAIHPESYDLASLIIDRFGLSDEITIGEKVKKINEIKTSKDLDMLAKSLNTGSATLTDILDELSHPGRDPREDLPKPILRTDVLSMKDLSQGMQLKGTIRNVVDFGAFVDIGVKIDGLLHRSKIPANVSLKVGDIVEVIIVSIEEERNRIALSMKENSDK